MDLRCRRTVAFALFGVLAIGMLMAIRTMPYMASGESQMCVPGEAQVRTVTRTSTVTRTVTVTVQGGMKDQAPVEPVSANPEEEVSKDFALLPLDSAAPRVVTVDYGVGPRNWSALHPVHNPKFVMRVAYPPFAIRLPYFVNEDVRIDYYRLPYLAERQGLTKAYCDSQEGAPPKSIGKKLCTDRHRDEIIYYEHSHTEGSIEVIRDVRFRPHECGWMTTADKVQAFPGDHPTTYDKVASLDVPEGCSFQHFMDGVFPKIAQAMPLLRDPEVKLMTPACSNWPMVNKLYAHLGIASDRLVNMPGEVTAREYYSFCDAPAWHPIIWNQMKQLLRTDESVPVAGRKKLVYLQRNANARNGGRKISNEKEFVELLEHQTRSRGLDGADAFELELVTFDSSKLPEVQDNIDFFKDVAVLIGPHGGAFYNMMYCPPGTIVIEFIPRKTPFFLFAQMSSMLGHEHWYLPMGDEQENAIDLEIVGQLLHQALRTGPALP